MKKLLCLALILLGLSACQQAAPTATPFPTATATLVATRTPFIMPTAYPSNTPVPVTPTNTPIVIDTFSGEGDAPPFSISLPAEWGSHYDTAFTPLLGELDYVPFAFYKGPVTGGSGTIVALWNFRSVTSASPLDPNAGQVNLALDGSRLLRSLVVENRCNVGVDGLKDTFSIGGQPASGSMWSAVACPDNLPDTRGWFAGIEVEPVSFLFYAFTEPISAMDGPAVQEMQTIIDSVVFHPEMLLPSMTLTPTPG